MSRYLCILLVLVVSIHFSVSQDIPDESYKTVQNGVLNFGVKLNSILMAKNTEKKNILISPFNIYNALALIHLASNGTTRDEIADVLGMPKTYSPQTLHKVLQNFSVVAQNNPEKMLEFNDDSSKNRTKVSLNLANGIFVQEGMKLKESYVKDAQLYYNSEINNVDFVMKINEATDIINKYIANKTENRISQLFKEPPPDDTRIILTSSLYFKSQWLQNFDAYWSRNETFYADNGEVIVPMMREELKNIPYANISSLKVEVVDLKYANEAFSMFVVLPYKNRPVNEFLRDLTANDINTIVNQTTEIYDLVNVKLPRTAFKWSKSIKNEIMQLGLKQACSDGADLSNMLEQTDMKIGWISHSTDITIDENGTEAGAVTSEGVSFRSDVFYKKFTNFFVNRPFVFFIYQHEINTVLFFGTVYNPLSN